MGSTQHWDDPERIAQRQQAMRDPNPHLRAGSDPRLQAALAREVEAIQRAEILGTPTNFLPPDRRTSTTTPAGVSVYTIADPRPHTRVDATVERLRAAVFAREIADHGQLSGGHDTHANTRHFDAPHFAPVTGLDAAGRPENTIDWSTAHRRPDG